MEEDLALTPRIDWAGKENRGEKRTTEEEEKEGREREKAYTIALGGYWICNRGHTGYKRILLQPSCFNSLSFILSPSCRNCEPFSRIEDVAAVQSLD